MTETEKREALLQREAFRVGYAVRGIHQGNSAVRSTLPERDAMAAERYPIVSERPREIRLTPNGFSYRFAEGEVQFFSPDRQKWVRSALTDNEHVQHALSAPTSEPTNEERALLALIADPTETVSE
jgi:hypothetical protein